MCLDPGYSGSTGDDNARLNMNQVRLYEPPLNFSKETDSRYQAYVEQFGEECWIWMR